MPTAPVPKLRGPGGELASQLAYQYVREAVEVVYKVLKTPQRGSRDQLSAARIIFELAANLEPEKPSVERDGKVLLLDAQKAAERLSQMGWKSGP